ncbi:MAG: hypothetical protein FWC02_00045 [Firmicutes bacterium]|nr:hypothetical protein [Bacillota bacterium]
MKRKIMTIIMSVFLLFGTVGVMTGCENGGDYSNGQDPYVLLVWAPSEEQQMLRNMSESFLEANPTFADIVRFEFSEMSMTNVTQMVLRDGAMAANIFKFPSGAIPELGDNLMPITSQSVLQRAEENFTEDSLVSARRSSDNALVAFPASPNNFVLHYNSNLLSANDVRSLEGILNANTTAQYNLAMSLNDAWFNKVFFLTAGATLFGEDGMDPTSSTFNGPAGMIAAQHMWDMAIHPNFMDDTGGGAVGNYFRSGNLAAFFGPPISRNDVFDAIPTHYSAAPLPTININGVDTQMVDFIEHRAYGVHAQTGLSRTDLVERAQIVFIATLFAEYITNPINQMIRFQLNASAPTVRALLEPTVHPEITNRPEIVASLEQARFNNVPIPRTPRLSSFWHTQGAFGAGIGTRAAAYRRGASTPPTQTEWQTLLDDLVNSITA